MSERPFKVLGIQQIAVGAPDKAALRRLWIDTLGLTITGTEQGGLNDSEGKVAFTARFRNGGQEHEHVETALFAREEGNWVYSGQETAAPTTVRRATPKIGRNDPCPCGSGKKYKKCCGAAA